MHPARIPEHESARQWRDAMGLSRIELAKRSGYSAGSIRDFEQGRKSNGEPIDPNAWRRYKLTCAALTAGIDFDWITVSFEITERKTVLIHAGQAGG
jgi:transcriptional regulator with XRE-family HTH domain